MLRWVFALAAFAPLTASASEWVKFSDVTDSTPSFVLAVDVSSVRETDGLTRVWVRRTYSESFVSEVDSKPVSHDRELVLLAIDCQRSTFTTRRVMYLNTRGTESTTVAESDWSELPYRGRDIAPDTQMDGLAKFVCPSPSAKAPQPKKK